MFRPILMSLPLFLLVFLSGACAEVYTWTDHQGTEHYTDDRGQIPQEYRKKARKLEVTDESPAAEPSSPTTEVITKEKTPSVKAGPSEEPQQDTVGTPVDKKYAQFAKELADRESAMRDIRKRTDAIQQSVNDSKLKGSERSKLIDEYLQLTEQFKNMKSEYHKQVEAVRNAGYTVEIKE